MGIAAYNRGSRVIREQIDREAEARRIAQSCPKVILLVDHPCNRDPTAQLTESTARMDKLSIFRVRGGYLASLGWPYCLDGLFTTEEAARKAQEEARA